MCNEFSKRIKVKDKIYDSIFSDLFSDKKNILQLYKELTGDDDSETTCEDIDIINIEKIFINDFYNDLGFVVKDEIIILMEAQSIYTKNIAIRLLFYYARTLETYLRKKYGDRLSSIYNSGELEIPSIKLYTVYTGSDKKIVDLGNHYIYLKELIKHDSKDMDVSLRVGIISEEKHANILGQYIEFSRLFKEKLREYGKQEKVEAIIDTIDIAVEKDILRDYLLKNKSEVMKMMAHLITQEEYLEFVKEEGIKIGKKEGKKEGIKEGMVKMCLTLGLSYDEIVEKTGLSKEEINDIKGRLGR